MTHFPRTESGGLSWISFLSRKNYAEVQESYKTERSETHGQGSFQDNIFLPGKAFQSLELHFQVFCGKHHQVQATSLWEPNTG